MSPFWCGHEAARIEARAADQRFADRFDRIARWVAFTVFLLLAFAATACAQTKSGRPIHKETTWKELAAFNGVTFCTERGVFMLVRPNLPPDELGAVMVHEAKHAEQYHRFPSCGAWQRDYDTPKGKLMSEAEAYGADLCFLVSRGYDKLSVAQDYASRLERTMGGEVNRLEIVQALNGFATC